MFYLCITCGLTIIHLYFVKIAWSFSTRLELGQELLVIHGKYLEKMLSMESDKNKMFPLNNLNNNNQANIYYPPTIGNSQNIRKNEMETFYVEK